MWWIRQSSKGTLQVGYMQVACIARRAWRWAGVASRAARPTSMARPWRLSTIGMISASQANWRTVETGKGLSVGELAHRVGVQPVAQGLLSR